MTNYFLKLTENHFYCLSDNVFEMIEKMVLAYYSGFIQA